MKHKLVRYRAKPGAASENRSLVQSVFEALKRCSPDDLGFVVFELADGSFVHLKSDFGEESFDLGDLPAFQAFGRRIVERGLEPPHPHEASIVGDYRMICQSDAESCSSSAEAQWFSRALTTCWINMVRGST